MISRKISGIDAIRRPKMMIGKSPLPTPANNTTLLVLQLYRGIFHQLFVFEYSDACFAFCIAFAWSELCCVNEYARFFLDEIGASEQ